MNGPKNKIKLFENRQVRAVWNEQAQKWWFSVLDIISILTGQLNYEKTKNYWKWLKKSCLLKEVSWLVMLPNLN